MWFDSPKCFSNVSISSSGNSLTVRSDVLEKYPTVNVIGVLGAESFIQKKITDNDYKATFTDVPLNYIVTVNGENSLPYVAPLFLQNEIVMGKHKIFEMNDVYIGDKVDINRDSGSFKVAYGSSLTIEYTGEILLDSGFEIEKGANFELKPVRK